MKRASAMSLAVGNLVLPGAAGRACFDRVRREGHATGCLQGNTAGDGLLGGHSALVDRLPALSGASVTWGRQWRQEIHHVAWRAPWRDICLHPVSRWENPAGLTGVVLLLRVCRCWPSSKTSRLTLACGAGSATQSGSCSSKETA